MKSSSLKSKMKVKVGPKKDSILYVRVTKENFEYVKHEAQKLKCSLSQYMDALISQLK